MTSGDLVGPLRCILVVAVECLGGSDVVYRLRKKLASKGFPEREQHTIAALDLATGEITERVAFMEGSKPHMLRVSPEGATIWVQTAATNTNAVLDANNIAVRTHRMLGNTPVSNAWSPDGRYSFVTHFGEEFVSVLDARYREEVKRIRVGLKAAHVAFRPDGRYA